MTWPLVAAAPLNRALIRPERCSILRILTGTSRVRTQFSSFFFRKSEAKQHTHLTRVHLQNDLFNHQSHQRSNNLSVYLQVKQQKINQPSLATEPGSAWLCPTLFTLFASLHEFRMYPPVSLATALTVCLSQILYQIPTIILQVSDTDRYAYYASCSLARVQANNLARQHRRRARSPRASAWASG